jgi:hypothetical protein
LIRGRLRAATEARICGRPPYGYISLLVGCGFTDIRESKDQENTRSYNVALGDGTTSGIFSGLISGWGLLKQSLLQVFDEVFWQK